MLFVTGAAGFIGSNFVVNTLLANQGPVLVLDALTYAGHKDNLKAVWDREDFTFVEGNITDTLLLEELFQTYQPTGLVHFAAESHVDRSISDPLRFVETNVKGTAALLTVTKRYLTQHPEKKASFRFINISTDEVYGSLDREAPPSDEETPFAPSSPYSASKASADHLGQAFFRTYGLPVITIRCTNNYGPRQYPEKLLPYMLQQALHHRPLTLYGNGQQTRDWIHVEDFVNAITLALQKGVPGECYNVGATNEISNQAFVEALCEVLDRLAPSPTRSSYKTLITYVEDRPGHDVRYALDATKIKTTLGWKPQVDFERGLESTIRWYLERFL